MEEECFGYYLHGRPPWSASEIPLEWLQDEIAKEAAANTSGNTRGLPNAPKPRERNLAVQTFQIYLPKDVRRELRKIYDQPVPAEELTDEVYIREVYGNQGVMEAAGPGAHKKVTKRHQRESLVHDDDLEEDEQKMMQDLATDSEQKQEMTMDEKSVREQEIRRVRTSNFLKQHLSENIKQEHMQIHKHGTFSRLLKMPADTMTENSFSRVNVVEDDVEYHPSFESLLMGSIDKDLVQCYGMFFYVFERATNNSLLAVFLVWLIEYFLSELRARLAKNHLAKRAYIDDVFLK